MEAIVIFPTVIGTFDLDRSLTEEELSTINEILKNVRRNQENSTSTDYYVLDNPALKELKKFVTSSIDLFQTHIMEESTTLEITQSWLNISKKNEFHHYHCHPNSYLSGVFYVNTDETDSISFGSPINRETYYKTDYINNNLFNSTRWRVPSLQNRLLLFRSDIWHSTTPTQHDNRISLSFNTFLSGTVGSSNLRTELILP